MAKQNGPAPIEDETVGVPVAEQALDRQRFCRYARKTLGEFGEA